MTREEKIAELINIRDNFNYTLAPREVFDDAIKALEQAPKLQNRCYALTQGQMCMFCPYDCERRTIAKREVME
jgi:hypothetical protein